MDSSLTEQFKNNLERWKLFCPAEADKLQKLSLNSVSLHLNQNGQLNIRKIQNGRSFLLHSPQDVYEESQQWFSRLHLQATNVLYVLGIGLGYYYLSLKEWLAEDKTRSLVFFEPDLEVTKLFLSGDLAYEILHHPQVGVYYLGQAEANQMIDSITNDYIFKSFKTSALESYAVHYSDIFRELDAYVSFYTNLKAGIMVEYISNSSAYFSNFYLNLFELPSAKQGNALFGKFKNVPAIICGAGPSLAKNIDLLAKLTDRAMIFAGGTAMNAINAKGIIPHFGVGIDPHSYQFTRLIANQAFEVPFFYRQRINHQALHQVHSPKLYITGAGGYNITDWFETGLGIEGGNKLSEGFNVINFSLSIAHALGCNPIYFVGVDLAYSENQNYSPGIINHAIHDFKLDFRTKSFNEELIIKNDIYGNPVPTLWKWVNESIYLSSYAQTNPDLFLCNCTEGGLGFEGIPNVPLAEIADKFLQNHYDFNGWIHAEIEKAGMPPTVTTEKIIEKLQEFSKSLHLCMQKIEAIQQGFIELAKKMEDEQASSSDLISESMKKNIGELREEAAYQFLLKVFEENVSIYSQPRIKSLELEKYRLSEKEYANKKIDIFLARYEFLNMKIKSHLGYIENALKTQAEKTLFPRKNVPAMTLELLEKLKNDRPSSEVLPKAEGSMSIFYGAKGEILSESQVIDHVLNGFSRLFYHNGSLYSIQRFKEGKWHGRQEFYYPDGLPKTILHYHEGQLEGSVTLFYPDGRLKREMYYAKGKREGNERIWNDEGLMIIEAEYKEDKPVGTAREWYDNGNIAKEVTYNSDDNSIILKRWESNGMPWPLEKLTQDDYFDKVTKRTEVLTDSIGSIFQALKNVSDVLPQDSKLTKEDILALEREFEQLSKFSKEIVFESGLDPKNIHEALWKSQSSQEEVQEIIDKMTKEMQDSIALMRRNVAEALKALDSEKEQKQIKDPEKN